MKQGGFACLAPHFLTIAGESTNVYVFQNNHIREVVEVLGDSGTAAHTPPQQSARQPQQNTHKSGQLRDLQADPQTLQVTLLNEQPQHHSSANPTDRWADADLSAPGLSLAEPVSAHDRVFVAKHIGAEQVRLLYRFSPVGYLAELMVTFLLGAILWNDVGQRLELFIWFMAASVVMICRYGLYKFFIRANPKHEALVSWETRFVIGCLLMAGLWGVMGSVLLPKSGSTQLPVMMLVALLFTGAVAYLAPHRTLFILAALVSLLPMGVMTLVFGDRSGSLLGATIAVLAGILVVVHSKVHKALLDSLTARFDNVLTTMRLEEKKAQVEQANRALEQSSVDRRIAGRAGLMALQRLKLHIERTPLAVIEWDMEFRVVTWNPAAEAIFGYKAEQMLGESGYALVNGKQENEQLASMWMELMQSHHATRVSLTNKTRRGEEIHTEWYNAPLVDDGNKVIGVASLVQDVTERKKDERMKSEFISTVSHELRTPLTSIRGALSLVLGKHSNDLPEKVRRLLDTAKRNSERLTLLINDILDLEKLDSGQMEFDLKPLDLAALARQALADNEGYAHQHTVHLRLVEAPERASVRADEHRLLQVFANLLSNAIKYSSKNGEVEISVRACEQCFRVSVRDHGRGIPQEFRSRMFRRFSQADSSDTREKGGTGLGLSISKAIVEQHGGRIDYVSGEGAGCEFFFDLPAWNEIIEPATPGAGPATPDLP